MAAKKPPITRVRIAREELEKMSNEDFLKCWTLQEQYVDHLEKTLNSNSEHTELLSLRESEGKLRQQQLDATRRENILVMRLTTKEQEMQEFAGQIQELKQAQVPSIAQLRSALLDPAVNLLFEKMRKEMDSLKARLVETQNELNAWKFTPDSNTGKRLMAKCRLLYQENEELGKIISSGRMAKLEGDLALQKSFSEEMKKSQSELDEFLLELDEDVEGMQSTIYYLQQQLRESKDQIAQLQKEKLKVSGLPNGSPLSHRLSVPEEAMDINCQSSHLHPSFVGSNKESDLSKSECNDAVNGNESVASLLLAIKSEEPLSAKDNEVNEQVLPETSKKVIETSVILSANDIKQEFPKTNSTLESNVQSVIVENKNVVVNQEKQTPLIERTNLLVDDNESTQEIVLRTNEQASEDTTTSVEITQNSTNSKRTPEGGGGRGRKRTRARAALEPEDKKESSLPVRKRTRRTREAINAGKKQASLEIDTDTEVQVAQTLAYWASANKERTEVQPDPSCNMLGNGEIVKKDTESN